MAATDATAHRNGDGDAPSQRETRIRERAARREVLAPLRLPLAFANGLVLLSALCAVVPFLLIVEAARTLLADPTADVWPLLAWAVAGLAARALLYSGALLWTHLLDGDNQFRLSRLIADKLRRVPLGWFGARRSADVKKLLQNDLESIHYLVAHAQVEFTAAIAVPVASLAYLFFVDWRVALALLVPLAGYAVALSVMMGRDYAERMREYQRLERETEATTIEFVDGIQVVRAFGQSGRAHRRFDDSVNRFADFFEAWTTPMTRIESIATVLLNPVCLLAVVLLVSLPLISAGWMPAVDILPFILLGLGLGTTVLTAGSAMHVRSQADAAVLRVHDLLHTPELEQRIPDARGSAVEARSGISAGDAGDVPDASAVTIASGTGGLVRYEHVRFAYREGSDVLRDVSLTLHPGTITALVGPSGSGKSTLASLLPRFADVDDGRITIDGRDIRDLPPNELYSRVGFVFQDVRLLRDTVRANIAIAKPGTSDARVEQIARAAHIHDRIMQLPRGYDSVIGVDAHLSGGEAQRLSIARALLADAPILVLDEATAFADAESEAAIQDALAALLPGRTVLVIAHRLHTITGVDKLVVLDGGRIVEEGTHEELLAADGTYAGLWRANQAAAGEQPSHDLDTSQSNAPATTGRSTEKEPAR